MCAFVWNLISASGPMALVCLHPKSKLCNYDDRPVLFISHLCLSLSVCLGLPHSLSPSFSISLSLFFSPSDLSVSPLKGKEILNSKTVTNLITPQATIKSLLALGFCAIPVIRIHTRVEPLLEMFCF